MKVAIASKKAKLEFHDEILLCYRHWTGEERRERENGCDRSCVTMQQPFHFPPLGWY
jgi:hypothetical protein